MPVFMFSIIITILELPKLLQYVFFGPKPLQYVFFGQIMAFDVYFDYTSNSQSILV